MSSQPAEGIQSSTTGAVPGHDSIRLRVNMDILPQGTRTTFVRDFVPKLLEYVGTLPNPWELQDVHLGNIMQNIWADVFGDSDYPLGHTIAPGTAMYKLVSRRAVHC